MAVATELRLSKAERVLHWKASVNRREGLIKTIEYFRSHLDEIA